MFVASVTPPNPTLPSRSRLGDSREDRVCMEVVVVEGMEEVMNSKQKRSPGEEEGLRLIFMNGKKYLWSPFECDAGQKVFTI